MLTHITDTERIWLGWYRRLRVAGYVGTAADLYRQLTGRPHPRVRGEAS